MKKLSVVMVGLGHCSWIGSSKSETAMKGNNPFFNEYQTPFQVPPF